MTIYKYSLRRLFTIKVAIQLLISSIILYGAITTLGTSGHLSKRGSFGLVDQNIGVQWASTHHGLIYDVVEGINEREVIIIDSFDPPTEAGSGNAGTISTSAFNSPHTPLPSEYVEAANGIPSNSQFKIVYTGFPFRSHKITMWRSLNPATLTTESNGLLARITNKRLARDFPLPDSSKCILNVAIWFLVISVLAYALLLFRAVYRRRRNLCIHCGYPSSGITNCPECGTAVVIDKKGER